MSLFYDEDGSLPCTSLGTSEPFDNHHRQDQVRKVQVICSSSIRRGYEKTSAFFIHPFFNNDMKWPSQTKIRCFHDHHPFDGIPIPLPVSYDEKTNTYTTFGIFCSASCVKSYMMDHPVNNNSLSLMYLKKMMAEVYDVHGDIMEAPAFALLEDYGGLLDINTFRASSTTGKRIIMHQPPFMACSLAFELVNEHGKDSENVKYEEDEKHQRAKGKRLSRKKGLGGKSNKNSDGNQCASSDARNGDKKPVDSTSRGSLVSLMCESNNFNETNDINSSDDPSNFNTFKHTNSSPTFFQKPALQDQPSPMDLSLSPPPYSQLHAPTSPQNIFPSTVTLVKANAANPWEIRGLNRPHDPIESFHQKKYRSGTSTYEKFLEEKKSQMSLGDTSSSVSQTQPALTSVASAKINNTTSPAHPPSSTTQDSSSLPAKKRGRPKGSSSKRKPNKPSQQNPSVKSIDTSQSDGRGTLMAFLKY